MTDTDAHEPLLARLDALRDYLRKERDGTEALSLQEALDHHLATVDDACEVVLEASPGADRRDALEIIGNFRFYGTARYDSGHALLTSDVVKLARLLAPPK